MDIAQTRKYLKCPKHPFDIEFLQVNELQNSDRTIMYCKICLDEDESFESTNYLLLYKLIEQESNQILKKWPPLNNNSILDNLIKETENQESTNSLQKKINDFFDQLTKDIMEKISICKKKMINLSSNLPLHNDKIIKKYNEVSKINELRQYMIDESTDLVQKEKQCKLIIEQMQRDKEKNTQEIQNFLNEHISIKNLINFDIPQVMKEQILFTIDQIDFFNHNKISHSFQRGNERETHSHNNNQNIEKLIELISNKSNYCSDQFLSSLKEVFIKINPLINQLSFKDIFQTNKQPIDFKQLNDNELESIKDLTTHFQRRTNENNYLENIKQSEMFQSIQSIICNKLNFLKEDIKDQLKSNLVEAYPLLVSKINNNDIFIDNQWYETFNNISMKQLKNIHKLLETSSKIKQSNQQMTSQSQRAFTLIKDRLFEYKKTDLEQLCQEYPIFDLLEPQIKVIHNIDFTQTLFQKDSNQIKLIKNNINEIKMEGNSSTFRGQCVSNFILDIKLKYVFRFLIQGKSNNIFQIGLVRDSQKDEQGTNDNLSCGLKLIQKQIQKDSDLGIQNKLKGNNLIENSDEQEIELRVCIEDKILEITNYPNYDCKIVISDQYKNNLTAYQNLRLNILLKDQCITLKQAFTVDNFEMPIN